MGKTLDIIDRQMKVGQVKIIKTGEYLDYVELLFSSATKVQFAPSDDMKAVRLTVSDNSLELPQLDCIVSKSTLYDYIISLKNLYNQLKDESEKNK